MKRGQFFSHPEQKTTNNVVPKPDLTAAPRSTLNSGVILGDSGAGKTALMRQLLKGQFSENFESTEGAALGTITLDNKHIVSLWDLSGAEKYHVLTRVYTKPEKFCFLAFNVCRIDTFNRLEYWLNILRMNLKANTPIILVGTQIDRAQERAIAKKEVEELVEKWNEDPANAKHRIKKVIETSAKTREGLNDFLECITQCVESLSLEASAIPESLFSQPLIKQGKLPQGARCEDLWKSPRSGS